VTFIDADREAHGLEPICSELPIALTTYYEANPRGRDPGRVPPRVRRDRELEPEI
jgi:hypothetical protein